MERVLGQLEVVKTYYARLTERERYIVIGVGSGGGLLFLITIYLSMVHATSNMAQKIESARENLRKLDQIRLVYNQTEQQVRDLDASIKRTEPGFPLGTHLEQLAKKNSITIDSLKDRSAPPNDYYQENQVTVSIRQVKIRTLIDFLYEIENSQALLRIQGLQVKPNYQDPTLLQVTFTVSTFSPVQGS